MLSESQMDLSQIRFLALTTDQPHGFEVVSAVNANNGWSGAF